MRVNKINIFSAYKTTLSISKDLVKLYMEKKIGIWASALTYYVVLSIVPILSIIFGIAKGFSLDKNVLKSLQNILQDNPDLVRKIYTFVQNVLARTSGGLVSGVGVVILCYSTYNLLDNIEISMNQVWRMNHPRTLKEKLPQYFMFLILAPILMSISISLQTLITSFQNNLLEFVHHQIVLYKSLVWLFWFINTLLLTFVISLFYTLMPQVKNMSFKYTFWISLVVSILYELFTNVYFLCQSKLSNYNAVYGSFAAIPITLIWLQISWTIILLGNSLNYLLHKHFNHIAIQEQITLSAKEQKILSLYVLQKIIQYFKAYKKPITQKELYKECNTIPITHVNRIIQFLIDIQYIEIIEKKEGTYLLLSIPIEAITIDSIFNYVETWTSKKIQFNYTLPTLEKGIYDEISKKVSTMLHNKKI